MDQKRKRPAAQMRAKTAARKSKPSSAKPARAKSSRDKVRAYRERMRAKGLRLMQMWVPDTQEPTSAHELPQSRRIGRADTAAIRKAWAEALAVQPSGRPVTFDQIAYLAGSVDGPEMDMRHKGEYLRATGYGRNRHR